MAIPRIGSRDGVAFRPAGTASHPWKRASITTTPPTDGGRTPTRSASTMPQQAVRSSVSQSMLRRSSAGPWHSRNRFLRLPDTASARSPVTAASSVKMRGVTPAVFLAATLVITETSSRTNSAAIRRASSPNCLSGWSSTRSNGPRNFFLQSRSQPIAVEHRADSC